jgi:hypothetical protein
MTRLASRFGAANLIRRDRPLTREELFRVVPSVFSEDKHESRSERIPIYPPFPAGQPAARRLSAVLCLSDPSA